MKVSERSRIPWSLFIQQTTQRSNLVSAIGIYGKVLKLFLSHFQQEIRGKNGDKQHSFRRGIYKKKKKEVEYTINTPTHRMSRAPKITGCPCLSSQGGSLLLQMRNSLSLFFFLSFIFLIEWHFCINISLASLLLSISLVTASGSELCSSLGEQKSVDHFTKHYLLSPREQVL